MLAKFLSRLTFKWFTWKLWNSNVPGPDVAENSTTRKIYSTMLVFMSISNVSGASGPTVRMAPNNEPMCWNMSVFGIWKFPTLEPHKGNRMFQTNCLLKQSTIFTFCLSISKSNNWKNTWIAILFSCFSCSNKERKKLFHYFLILWFQICSEYSKWKNFSRKSETIDGSTNRALHACVGCHLEFQVFLPKAPVASTSKRFLSGSKPSMWIN